MKKSTRIVKRLLALFLVVLMSINTFAAVVGDNDGAAFITKAEFDSLKNDFQSQLDTYNSSIDNKIDGAIANYLASLKIAASGTQICLSPGIFWSIGPFERPRYKRGIPLQELCYERAYFKEGDDTCDCWKIILSWGSSFTNKIEVEDSAWAYTDIIVNNVVERSGVGYALLDGVYKNSSHFLQNWQLNQLQSKYQDHIALHTEGDDLCGGLSGVPNGSNTHELALSFRGGASGSKAWFDCSLYVANRNVAGALSQQSINKGSKIEWNNNISCFAPIEYNCFNQAKLNVAETYVLPFDIRDEILYDTVDMSVANSASHNNLSSDKNAMYGRFPSVFNTSLDPWPITGTTNKQTSLRAGMSFTGSGYMRSWNMDFNYGWFGETNSSINTYFKRNYYFLPDVNFRPITNWSHIGNNINSDVETYLSSLSGSNATFKDDTDTTLLSLAAGVPIFSLEKKKKVIVTGEFKKNCQYTYTSNQNILDEGTTDDSEAYVVFAKLTPFDITSYPEEESDLIDISPETKDVANVGKLEKCRIVRDGKLKIEIENESNVDKVVFLKWEKLSNWQDIGNTRKTGDGTNTDVRVRDANTGTISPPTWTYFGGGYLKFDDRFEWVEIN